MAETSEIVRSVCIIMDALHQRTGAITDAHQAYGYIVLSHDVTPLPEAGRTEAWPDRPVPVQTRRWRSEEHTSELQSLMRNSYAVFCLKKKNQNNILHTICHHLHTKTNDM